MREENEGGSECGREERTDGGRGGGSDGGDGLGREGVKEGGKGGRVGGIE